MNFWILIQLDGKEIEASKSQSLKPNFNFFAKKKVRLDKMVSWNYPLFIRWEAKMNKGVMFGFKKKLCITKTDKSQQYTFVWWWYKTVEQELGYDIFQNVLKFEKTIGKFFSLIS